MRIRVGIDLDGNRWIDWEEGTPPNLIPNALFFDPIFLDINNASKEYLREQTLYGLMKHRVHFGQNHADFSLGWVPVLPSDPFTGPVLVKPVRGGFDLFGVSPSVDAPYLIDTIKGPPDDPSVFSIVRGSVDIKAPAGYIQTAFRGRYDDGDLDTATWIAAENENFEMFLDIPFRVRFQVVALEYQPTAQLQLQFRINGGSWENVGPDTAVRYVSGKGATTYGNPITQKLSTPVGVTDYFGIITTGIGRTDVVELFDGEFIEFEETLELHSGSISDRDQIDLRMVALIDGEERKLYAYENELTITAAVLSGVAVTFYRVRLDDGDENGATWASPVNENYTLEYFETYRVRFRIDNDSGITFNETLRLQLKVNDGDWFTPTNSGGYRYASSNHVSGSDPITHQLGPDDGTFASTVMVENGATVDVNFVDGGFAEVEFVLEASDVEGASDGDVVQYRLVIDSNDMPIPFEGGTPLTTDFAEAGGSRFTPADLSGLIVWLDPDDKSTRFTDTAGTTPATTNNSEVRRLTNKGTGADFVGSTGGILQLDSTRGRDGLLFTLSVEALQSTTDIPDKPFYVAAVFKLLSGTSGTNRGFFGGVGTRSWSLRVGTSNKLQLVLTGVAVVAEFGPEIEEETVYVVELSYDASNNLTVWLNGSLVYQAQTTAVSFTTSDLMYGFGNNAFKGTLYEALVCSSIPSSGARSRTSSYLNKRWR